MPTNDPTQTPDTTQPAFGNPLLQANFSTPKQKQDKEYGRKLISNIYREQAGNSSNGFWGYRKGKWIENWKWSKGTQPMQEFLDMTRISGDQAFTNVDLTQNMQGPQFVETLVSSIVQNEEYPRVTAIDDGSVSEKIEEKIAALHRMKDKDNIAQLEEAGGIALEDPDAYVPEDELSAEVYFKRQYRLSKEIKFQQFLEKVMADNEFPQLRRRVVRDEVVVNCAAIKIEKGDNGFIGLRKGVTDNLIYNFFMSDSGKMELSYIGDVYSMKVRDLRKKYRKSAQMPNGLNEKEIYEIAKGATRLNVANRFNYTWTENYLYAVDRPYDDFSVMVFDCEIKVFDSDYYVSKIDNYGKENIQVKKDIPKPTSERASVMTTDKFTVYRGIWAVDADKMIFWGYPDVVIKPYMDIAESLFSWSIQIPNNDGGYVPALFARALEPLRTLTLAKLRQKQLIAEMAPAGYTLDVERCRDIDLGSGNILSLTDIISLRNQKGVVVWSSKGVNPNETNPNPPITELANAGSVPQMQELAAIIDRCTADIRALLGVPQYRDGTDVGDRTAAKLAEGQNKSSFNVTDFISSSVNSLFEEVFQKICMMKWDDEVLKNNQDDLLDTVFQVNVEMKDMLYEREQLEQNIQIAMKSVDANGQPLLSFKDAFTIRSIKDPTMQELYLANMVAENQKRSVEQKQQDVENNMKAQQQSNQQASEQAMQLQQEKLASEKEMEDFKATKTKEIELLKGFMQVVAKDESGTLINMLLPAIQQLVPNVTLPLMQENKMMVQAVQAQAQQEQQQAMQQQQIEQEAQRQGISPEELMEQLQGGQNPQEEQAEQGQPQMQPQIQ